MLSTINDGDLLAIIYLTDMIKESVPTKAMEFCKKIIPMINNPRLTPRRRLYSIFASGRSPATFYFS